MSTRKPKVPHDESEAWISIPVEARSAIATAWASGMPPMTSALYCRWWQLETWLRSLVYVELRSSFGSAWVDKLPKNSELRQGSDLDFRHMGTPDAQNLLAYSDASALFRITQDQWNLFEQFLPPRNVWAGRTEELLAIRNRIGHCRRPHSDDLARLEQTLRDLDGGAFLAASSFNDQLMAERGWVDSVVDGWVRMNHADAHLVAHAEQYDTVFELRHSRRPWAGPAVSDTISGLAGFVWHAFWYFRKCRSFDLRKFWREIEPRQDPIMMVCMDDESSLNVSFAALEEPKLVADAIGHAFRAALYAIGNRQADERSDTRLRALKDDVDTRVQIGTPWSAIDSSIPHMRIFGA